MRRLFPKGFEHCGEDAAPAIPPRVDRRTRSNAGPGPSPGPAGAGGRLRSRAKALTGGRMTRANAEVNGSQPPQSKTLRAKGCDYRALAFGRSVSFAHGADAGES